MPHSISLSRHGETDFNKKILDVLQDPDTERVQAILMQVQNYWKAGKEPTDALLKELREIGRKVCSKFSNTTPINDARVSLTENGKEKLIHSSKKMNELYKQPFDITIITPYDRTFQSFEIRKKHCKWFEETKLIIEDNFHEQTWGEMINWPDFSIFFSQHLDDFRQFISEGHSYEEFAKIGVMFYPFQNGELFVKDVRTRVSLALDQHIQKNIEKNIFTITHDMAMAAKALHLNHVADDRRRIEEVRNMAKVSPGGIVDYRKNESGVWTMTRKIEIGKEGLEVHSYSHT